MQIPKNFLIKILKQLERAGLLKLKRGVSSKISKKTKRYHPL